MINKKPIQITVFLASLLIAVQVYCANTEKYFNRGNAYLQKGNYSQAVSEYNKILKADPAIKDARLYHNLGVAYGYLGEYQGAAQCLKRSIEINPSEALTYYNLGQIYIALKQNKEAQESFEKAKELFVTKGDTDRARSADSYLTKPISPPKRISNAEAVRETPERPVEKAVQNKVPSDKIVMGPYLQNVEANAVTVIWWTNFKAGSNSSAVEYSVDRSYLRRADAKEYEPEETGFGNYYKQEARITGLQRGNRYNYRVVTSDGNTEHLSRNWTLSTAPGRFTNIRFAVLGDGRTDNADVRSRHRAVFNKALSGKPDFILYSGDMVYEGSEEHWRRFIRQIMCSNDPAEPGTEVGYQVPVYMVVGNHDIYDGFNKRSGNLETSMKRYKALCDNPDNESVNPHWRERYYAFSYGPCYFIVLDANNTSSKKYDNNDYLGPGETPDWEPDSEQYNWMVKQMDRARKEYAFTFVCFHSSPYCRGAHGGPHDPIRGYELRALDPLFHEYGVDAVITSHDHVVERCITGQKNYFIKYEKGLGDPRAWQDETNLNYIVEGNAGEASRKSGDGWEKWMSVLGDGKPPYYSAYYYSMDYEPDFWEGRDEYASFLSVEVGWHASTKKWKAAFRIIRVDSSGNSTIHDEWSMERADPRA